jgi:D-galactarolactone cycloisomerase
MRVPAVISDHPVTIAHVEAIVLRCRIETPVRTSFGVMYERPALLVKIIDENGFFGWGEVWCNFPACGAEHRALLVSTVFAPLLKGQTFSDPFDVYKFNVARTEVLALQAGEPGPFSQVIAGIDLALWDMYARRADMPLWQFLGGNSDEIGVYASGLNPNGFEKLVAEKLDSGFSAFKLKVGFGKDQDSESLSNIRGIIGGERTLMVDANQAWDLETALKMAPVLDHFHLDWLEEPIRADCPLKEWQILAQHCHVPLAAGENISGVRDFNAAIAGSTLQVVQPDIAKWGGISGCSAVVQSITDAGLRFCPHYLGGGIGLLASAHFLAAAGGAGLLEVDANPNPLRSLLCGPLETARNGRTRLGTLPGIGITPDLSNIQRELSGV